MKKGIIFDLDGTLWDACDQIAQSWTKYAGMKVPEADIHITEQDFRRACGLTMKAVGDMMFPQIEEPKRTELTRECCVYEVDWLNRSGGTLYPGLHEVLKTLKRAAKLYIVSNCQEGYIESFLAWSGTEDCFADTECYGRTGMEKADNIRLVIERNALEKTVYVGDTQMDFDSAAQAGIPFIHAAYGFGSVSEPVPKIHSLSELPEAAGRILSFPSDVNTMSF